MAFLTHMSDAEKREKLAAIPAEKMQRMIRGCWSGVPVAGLSLDAAMEKAGAAFTAERVPMFIDGKDGERKRVATHVALRNSRTGGPVSVVSRTFGVLQHGEAVEPLRPVLDRGDAALLGIDLRDGGAKFDAFALLGFGAVQRMGIEQADGIAYMLRASNAHDGTSAMSLALSCRRLRCDNGQGFWEHKTQERVKHTSRAATRLVDFGSELHALLGIAEASVATFQGLADTAMSASDFVEFAAEWLTETKGAAKDAKAEEKRIDDQAELLRLFQTGAGNLGRDRYDALNAVTEWLTPRRASYRDAARFVSAYYSNESGSRAAQRTKALRLLTR